MSEDNITLPFSAIKQSSLIGHLLINEQFFKLVYKRIKPTWFLSERLSQIYKFLVKYYDTRSSFPKINEFLTYSEINSLDLKEKGIIISYVHKCLMETQQIRLEAIVPELTEWLHSVILVNSLKEAQILFNKKDIKQCHAQLMEAVKEVTATTFSKGNEITFTDFKEYLQESEKDRAESITTGLKILDQSLLENAVGGGLQKGDTTIIMAPVNAGKTTFLLSVACHNIVKGKDVFLMTHEGAPGDIRLKILSNLLRCQISEIFNLYKTPEGIAKLQMITAQVDKHLKYIPYNKAGGMVIEEVVPIIRANQEDWMSEHNGKGFDLLISDYPAILTTELARKGTLQKRNADQVVYNNYVQLALEYQFHSLLAIQTNREGSKINSRISGDGRLLRMEDVKESWDPMAEASNVITINRSPHAENNNYIVLSIAKCRNNSKGLAIAAKSCYKNNTTHSEELGGFVYKPTRNPEELALGLFEQYYNQRVPDEETIRLRL